MLVLFVWLSVAASAQAGEADIINVTVSRAADSRYDFSVTVRHDDRGWNHFANRWEIVDTEGSLLATRVLLHPHVDEQPFTRRLNGVEIPAEIKTVTVRAHDLVHQYGGREVKIDLPEY